MMMVKRKMQMGSFEGVVVDHRQNTKEVLPRVPSLLHWLLKEVVAGIEDLLVRTKSSCRDQNKK
jgi:hypothetical protein